MTHVNIPALANIARPVVQIENGQAITVSTEVARVFGKQHKDVLRSIENLQSDLGEEHKRNFALMSIEVDIGNGATRKSPAYHLTRDGFTLLAMGFTGKKALAFKLAYIDAFNKMEAALTQPAPVQQSLPTEADMTQARDLPSAEYPASLVNEIVTSTTQSILEALQRKHLLVDWAKVTDALNDRNTTISFAELTDLIHAGLTRLQRSVNVEAYTAIHQRAARQGVPTTQVSLNA